MRNIFLSRSHQCSLVTDMYEGHSKSSKTNSKKKKNSEYGNQIESCKYSHLIWLPYSEFFFQNLSSNFLNAPRTICDIMKYSFRITFVPITSLKEKKIEKNFQKEENVVKLLLGKDETVLFKS